MLLKLLPPFQATHPQATKSGSHVHHERIRVYIIVLLPCREGFEFRPSPHPVRSVFHSRELGTTRLSLTQPSDRESLSLSPK